MTRTAIIGCDPGITGGIAVLRPATAPATYRLTLYRMPTRSGRGTRRVVDGVALANLFRPTEIGLLIIEDVHSRPTDGVVQAFQFGENTGMVIGVACGLGMSVSEVAPQVWKGVFGLTADKGHAIHRAGTLCPQAVAAIGTHHGMAEAFLIALYGLMRAGVRPLKIVYGA